ncbi:MAG: transposase family protein [Pseudonocardiaceae bacterium]
MSAQFAMPAIVSAIRDLVTEGDQVDEPAVGEADLRAVFEQVTDPRDRRGRRHGLAAILMLVQAAVVSGATTFAAIRHWTKAAPAGVLTDCGIRPAKRTGTPVAPHPDTVNRVLVKLDPAELDLAYARHWSAQMTGAGSRTPARCS